MEFVSRLFSRVLLSLCMTILYVVSSLKTAVANYDINCQTMVYPNLTATSQCSTVCPEGYNSAYKLFNTATSTSYCVCFISTCGCTTGTYGAAVMNFTGSGGTCVATCMTSSCCATGCSVGSPIEWVGTGCDGAVQSAVTAASCVNSVCNRTYDYRCAANYYGTPSDCIAAECTACPSLGGVAGWSDVGATVAAGNCYIRSGAAITGDAYGTYQFSSSCFYN